jgi:hypothetical protein
MEELNDGFALSPEQQDTASLLERLLGRAIADRYIDFSRLAASATGLRVSPPMAAHAFPERESMGRVEVEGVKRVNTWYPCWRMYFVALAQIHTSS